MKKVILNSKPTSLFFRRGLDYFCYLNIEPEYTEETKFKNSAFVKTGRVIPTGKYTALEMKLYSINKQRILTYSAMKTFMNEKISEYVSNKILSGFVWNGYKVWLSAENQQNYASWITSAKANPEVLPFTAKFNIGTLNKNVYYDFSSVEELEDFYSKAIKFINDTVIEGRKLKDYINDNDTLYRDSFVK